MRIVVAGGKSHADYLIGSLKRERHEVVAINPDKTFCEYLATCHDVPIIYGDASKRYVLDLAEIDGFDVFVALMANDADNLVSCQTVRRFYGIKKTVCTVADPQNVAVFKRLGVPIVLNETLIISEALKQASTVEALVESIEDMEKEIYPNIDQVSGTGSFEPLSPEFNGVVPRGQREAL